MPKYANGTIVKIDEDKQLVFGWASVIKDTEGKILLDRQEDFIESEEELEKAAYSYVLKSRDGGEMHIRKGVSTMVESVVLSKEKQQALGIPAGVVPIGWWVGFKVNDTRVWGEVKKGGYIGFSVHGTGQRTQEDIALNKITEVEKCACEPQAVAKYNPQYWAVMRKAQIAITESAISKGEAPGHPFRGNQWTRGISGGGTGGSKKSGKKKPNKKVGRVTARTIEEGVKRILAGETFDMSDIKGAHSLIKKLADMANDAESRGDKPIKYDLCKVSVKGTNLFCGGNKGIPRDAMPQAKGDVVKGSKAEKLLAKQNAKRVKNGKKPKTEVDGTEEFLAHLDKAGISASKPKRVRSDKLKATQQDMNGEKVGGMMTSKDYDPSKEPIFVSRDGYVVDGHHRWAATVGKDAQDGKLGNNHKMNVIVLDAPISQILKEANAWTDSFGIKRKTVGK
jgi:hypothetical protein